MILLSFFDGTTFFAGLALVLAGGLGLSFVRHRQIRRCAIALVIIGIVMVVVSAVALPYWAYGIWLVLVLSAVMHALKRDDTEHFRRWRRLGATALVTAIAGLGLAELPYQLAPRIAVPSGTPIYVIGDSLSAGIGRNEHCWPEVFGKRNGIPVVNLAMGGATAETALPQVQSVDCRGAIVVVEIGGNDLLGGTSAEDYRLHLDALLAELRAQGHRIVMFELPLYPFRNAYGAAQREMAVRYDVSLIPKRYLTRVIGMTDGTLDGLHFSQEGHDAMAEAMAHVLVPEKPGAK